MTLSKETIIDAVGATAFTTFMMGLARAGLGMMVELTPLGAGFLDIATIGLIVATPIAVIRSGTPLSFLEDKKESEQDWVMMPRVVEVKQETVEEEVSTDDLLPEVKTTDEIIPAVTADAVLVEQQVEQVVKTTSESVPQKEIAEQSQPVQTELDPEWEALFERADAMSESDVDDYDDMDYSMSSESYDYEESA